MGYRRKISSTKPSNAPQRVDPTVAYAMRAIFGDRWMMLPNAVLIEQLAKIKASLK